MANPLQRGSKTYPNGTNVPQSGRSNNRGPAGGLQNNRPAAQSTSSAVSSSTYQPFPANKSVSGATGVIGAASSDPELGSFKSPIRKALASRKIGGPSKMLGNQAAGSGRPSSGGRSSY